MNYKEEVLKIYPKAILETYTDDISGIKYYYIENSDFTVKSWVSHNKDKAWRSAWNQIQKEFLRKLKGIEI